MSTVAEFPGFGRHRWSLRALGWLGIAAVAPVGFACQARSVERPVLKPEQTYDKTFPQSINRNVDLLFLVDDSQSMRLSQDNLRRNFPTFMTRLKQAPILPNIHVAVVSSDMGAGIPGDIGDCDHSKNGVFQYGGHIIPPATTPCTTNLMPGSTFITDNGMGVSNYTGALEDVFTCMAALGEKGCGYEHQFASILRALGADDRPPPAENQGFLRDNAFLVIILITNEDDCSAAPGVALFGQRDNQLEDQLGPRTNFRCNEYGHLCDGAPPKREAPGNDVNATVDYTTCTSNDRDGYLLGVADTANRIKKLKRDPSQVIVASIAGQPSPYQVHWKAPPAGITDMSCGAMSCPWPEITHSCMAADGSFADPGVRIDQFVSQFGTNGLRLSICDSEFKGSLDRIAELINDTITPPCIEGRVAKKAGTQQDDCTVVSHTSDGSGPVKDSVVPSCASNGATSPCWQLQANVNGCAGHIVDPMALTDPRISTETTQNVTVNCALCVDTVDDPARGCCKGGAAPDGDGCCPPDPATNAQVCAN